MMTEQEQAAAIGTQYPLLFSYRDTLFGNAVVLEVQATNGRALCVKESEDEYLDVRDQPWRNGCVR